MTEEMRMLAMPYFLVFEAAGPVIELLEYVLTAVAIPFGLLDWRRHRRSPGLSRRDHRLGSVLRCGAPAAFDTVAGRDQQLAAVDAPR